MEKTLFDLFKERKADEKIYRVHVLHEAKNEWKEYKGTLQEISKQISYYEAQTAYVIGESYSGLISSVIEA